MIFAYIFLFVVSMQATYLAAFNSLYFCFKLYGKLENELKVKPGKCILYIRKKLVNHSRKLEREEHKHVDIVFFYSTTNLCQIPTASVCMCVTRALLTYYDGDGHDENYCCCSLCGERCSALSERLSPRSCISSELEEGERESHHESKN